MSVDNDTIRATFHLKDTRGWKLPEARMKLARESQWQDHFHNILYRPFDIREIYYSPQTVDWGRQEIMKNMLLPNLSICFVRQYSGQKTYSHALISKYMVDNRTFFSSKGIIQQAPLYIYDEDQRRRKQPFQVMMLLEPDHEYVTMKRRPNISSKVLQLLEDRYKKKPTPEQILYYCYAVLYSNKYRMSYSEFLKFDFPKIPFPLGFDIFNHMASLGEELAQLHLLDSTYLERPVVKCFGTGEDTIEKLTYDPVDKTLFINKHKYFDGITPEIWQYQVGGYQVLEKFLKDRKGQSMSDPATFCKISSALHYTMKTQEAIDQIFPIIEKENHDIALLPASPKI
jgi:predicted helicase